MKKQLLSVLLILIFFVSTLTSCQNTSYDIDEEIQGISEFISSLDCQYQPGTEWSLIAQYKAGNLDEDQQDNYYLQLEQLLKANKGVLDQRKYTEYSRTILALSIIGKDPTNVAGFDLTKRLEEKSQVAMQGINGPIWALIALDSGDYADKKTKEGYVDMILKQQLKDGGWDIANSKADPDMTAMALTALAPYIETRDDVKRAIDAGLDALSSIQKENGEFLSWEEETLESSAQVMIALCALGIDPVTDERFIKDDNNILDNILNYKSQEGGMKHIKDGQTDAMATEQGLLALEAYKAYETTRCGLYEGENR